MLFVALVEKRWPRRVCPTLVFFIYVSLTLADISLLQKRHNLWVANVSRRRLPTDAIPAQFLQTTIDAEDIIRQATLLARSPRE
jgi:hypothetical protein